MPNREVAGEQVERWTLWVCDEDRLVKDVRRTLGNSCEQPDHSLTLVEVVPASRLEQVERERDEAQARVASMTASALPVEEQERFIARVTERQSEERERAWAEAEQRAEQAEQRAEQLVRMVAADQRRAEAAESRLAEVEGALVEIAAPPSSTADDQVAHPTQLIAQSLLARLSNSKGDEA